MGTVDKQGLVTMQELLVSSLATADALAKLLIEKGLITQAEFMQKLSEVKDFTGLNLTPGLLLEGVDLFEYECPIE